MSQSEDQVPRSPPEASPAPDNDNVVEKNHPNPPSDAFSPTSIVLAKVKGYPPWPAMVLDEMILPDHILARRPKTVKLPPKRKNQGPVLILPVRFFSDDTYIWIKSSDIRPLTESMIEDFFAKAKRRRDNLLESAYTLAQNPLDMELFVKYGSSGKPPPTPEPELKPAEEDEDEDEDVEDNDNEEEEEEEEDDYFPQKKKSKPAKKPVKKKPITKSKPAKPKPKAKKPPKAEPVDNDPDWGIDEDINENYKQGNFIYENIKDQLALNQKFPKADTLAKRLASSTQKFDGVANQLIRKLMDLEPEPTGIDELITLLDQLSSISVPKSVISKSTLLKVLILTNRKDVEPKLTATINGLLRQWLGFEVDANPEIEEEEEVDEVVTTSEDGVVTGNGSQPPESMQTPAPASPLSA